ncbi:LysR family transcriptional regulator [Shewanella sp. Choline-02u-19]|uniref:LysR family transcriptional regulator n=1 Tax=unclassified Shewanella TaxID=196818 RepID=UPI000C330FE8|nr:MULTISPECIES: LysR family transcriptional regulator [unclassified Shewanella]PKG56718.1 LysR family transcriptional regulator [Shewanella sp. GutDb-MelDb]PKG74358.1 LysR family transcriptional regulator [Shewanella sp. GutCb]PKH57816.1 LysR family transcriptional regulator [Shewanella sp. Bg11-22]PKI29766.1 LysR family transcriptional regulator [Shewanella sp. Choline-02u-19]
MDHLRHMAIFKQIVDAGSISAAADNLALSKSVVSHHLKSLEVAIGVQLLHRTTRKQQLTPAGTDFYQHCKQMADISQVAWREARDTGGMLAGPIRISAPHALIDSIVAPAISQLCNDNPLIRPTITVADQRIDLLSDDIDLVIRVGKLPSSNLMQRQLGHFRDVICASPDYIDKHQTKIDAEQWQSLDYIANSWQKATVTHSVEPLPDGKIRKAEALKQLNFVANRFTDNSSAVGALAKAGLGISLLPEFVFKQAEQQGLLAMLLPDYQCPMNAVYAVHDFGRKPPLLVTHTIEAVMRHFI